MIEKLIDELSDTKIILKLTTNTNIQSVIGILKTTTQSGNVYIFEVV